MHSSLIKPQVTKAGHLVEEPYMRHLSKNHKRHEERASEWTERFYLKKQKRRSKRQTTEREKDRDRDT